MGAVHGDDFYVPADKEAITRIGNVLTSKNKVRESHRLDFGEHCAKSAAALNRILTLGEQDVRKFVQSEPQIRHVEQLETDK